LGWNLESELKQSLTVVATGNPGRNVAKTRIAIAEREKLRDAKTDEKAVVIPLSVVTVASLSHWL
jgi:hypothetical protein